MSREFVVSYVPEKAICAEIGVWKGSFSEKILERKPARLFLIDPWKAMPEFGKADYGKLSQEEMDEIFNGVRSRFKGNVEIIRKVSLDAVGDFRNNMLDFVYIDANYSYPFVLADLICWYHKVRKGGIISGDDYGIGGWWKGGVRKAVKHCLKILPLEKIEIKDNQFILRKSG